MSKDCSCYKCQGACKKRPGWFIPSQIPSLLKHFNVDSILELVRQKKVVLDYWYSDPKNIYVLAPNIVGNDDTIYPYSPRGQCVFFLDGKCSIHEIKPYECREHIHDESSNVIQERKEGIVKKWNKSISMKMFMNNCNKDLYNI